MAVAELTFTQIAQALRTGAGVEAEVRQTLGSLSYAFVNGKTETATKVVSIGSRRKRP